MAQDMQLSLSNLQAPEGSRKKRIRVGRGTGSGLGKTSAGKRPNGSKRKRPAARF